MVKQFRGSVGAVERKYVSLTESATRGMTEGLHNEQPWKGIIWSWKSKLHFPGEKETSAEVASRHIFESRLSQIHIFHAQSQVYVVNVRLL